MESTQIGQGKIMTDIISQPSVGLMAITPDREYRHIFETRCNPRARWEIKDICLKMLEVLRAEAPIVFGDFEIDRENNSARLIES